MSDTRHSLADGEGKKALLQVSGEDLARLVRIGRAIGQADTSLEEVLRACILHSLLMADVKKQMLCDFDPHALRLAESLFLSISFTLFPYSPHPLFHGVLALTVGCKHALGFQSIKQNR